ncbi:MAG: branched-chain amino acid ABC transporter permease [SAR324 cluster bacterium]|jgi:branched-chain amino acid transport system permease protein|nr:branched-chain amino acid ABC transporter permease [Pseudomonadota bacterium]MBI14295.1 branched-chain amino acid ABC transporter permease [Deltaproteobacteria bacterium]MBU06337.1 branched-chain amino acid ABC transporter permease [Dehalococcoidales bacterium]MDP6091375.1 branched-chain amino acid ABC transporter permease [SAR324 cluster bacterium]MDP7138302.1 branched-chain amino acid ABC transporter permease [SAR324 cluster bacterium]|tara:strand:- start:133 stop:1446 length:1314 start_codon:yes stop_codon:yes gene_type:complete
MKTLIKNTILFGIMLMLLVTVGIFQSWNVALAILNLCLISAIMTMGVNIQWGYAGLFNAGVMGFTALGGIAAVVISIPPVQSAWLAGGSRAMLGLLIGVISIFLVVVVWKKTAKLGRIRYWLTALMVIGGYALMRMVIDPAIEAIEAIEPAKTGFLGGFGLPVIFSWIVGGAFAASVAWVVGRVSLGLRSDYLAIATLGISEIIIYFLKYEEWLTRGVKNVNGIPRPVPYEIDLQKTLWLQEWAERFEMPVIELSSIIVKISYASLFITVLLVIFYLSETALKSPWGRMMRAIRDNETAANAMGKNVTWRHLQVFVLGSAVVGMAGAMLTTLDGQFTPASYQPMRFTFLVWVMVIVGGSGNNLGSVLGGFVIWFFWIEAEPIGLALMNFITSGMSQENPLRIHLLENAAHMRLMTMGLVLLLTLRFAPKGLIPEVKR